MRDLSETYPDKASVENTFPIAALWVELRKVINREALDDKGYTKTTKRKLLAKLNSQKALAAREIGYDYFEEIRCEANREMYNPLGRTSALLKKWNLAVAYILDMYGMPKTW